MSLVFVHAHISILLMAWRNVAQLACLTLMALRLLRNRQVHSIILRSKAAYLSLAWPSLLIWNNELAILSIHRASTIVCASHLSTISIIEELLRSSFPRCSNLSLLLLIAIMSSMSTSIVAHNTAFFADITEVMWLVPSHLQTSRIISSALISSRLIWVILLGLDLHSSLNCAIVILQNI